MPTEHIPQLEWQRNPETETLTARLGEGNYLDIRPEPYWFGEGSKEDAFTLVEVKWSALPWGGMKKSETPLMTGLLTPDDAKTYAKTWVGDDE
jgi:hypothetical protein